MKKEFTKKQIKEAVEAYKANYSLSSTFGIFITINLVAMFTILYLDISDLAAYLFIAWAFFSASLFKHQCTHCKGKMRLHRNHKECPHCKIPLRKPIGRIRELIDGFGKVIFTSILFIAALLVYFRNEAAGLYFTNSKRVEKGLVEAVALNNKLYEILKNEGELSTLEGAKFLKKYDSSIWVRVGVVEVENNGDKILLIYNYDSKTKVEDFIKDKQELKCAERNKKRFCIPIAYIADEVKFNSVNSVKRSKEYIKNQFAGM